MSLLRRRDAIALAIVAAAASLLGLWWWRFNTAPRTFNGDLAYRLAEAQMKFGPRPSGSAALRQTGDFIIGQLETSGWPVETQEFTYKGTPVRNIIAQAARGQGPVIIVGAHYDTRRRADQDPTSPQAPVPGANDGASGAAVLLELARTLDRPALHHEIWLTFFDAEDNGNLDGWEWAVGSTYLASHLTITPKAMILADMVGDADQQIYLDVNSNQSLSLAIFDQAAQLGYSDYFIPRPKYAMIDDHTPFAARGIPAVDLIDFDYPYWHRTTDTLDKLSPASLEHVGRTLQSFLEALP